MRTQTSLQPVAQAPQAKHFESEPTPASRLLSYMAEDVARVLDDARDLAPELTPEEWQEGGKDGYYDDGVQRSYRMTDLEGTRCQVDARGLGRRVEHGQEQGIDISLASMKSDGSSKLIYVADHPEVHSNWTTLISERVQSPTEEAEEVTKFSEQKLIVNGTLAAIRSSLAHAHEDKIDQLMDAA